MAGVLFFGLLATWLLLPGLELTSTVRTWLAILWTAFRSSSFGHFLPPSLLALSSSTILAASLAAILPRTAYLAWRSFTFIRRRKKAARFRAGALVV